MKTFIRFFLVLFVSATGWSAMAQIGSVIVFAPAGEKFTLFIGSNEKNHEPSARVEADNPGGPTFKIRVVFPDPAIHEISKLVFNKPGSTMFYKVGKNAKGAYALESTSSEWMDEGVAREKTATPPPTPPPSETKSKGEVAQGSNEPAKPAKIKGCDNPLSEPDFNAQLVGIGARPFESIKLSAAKKVAETHCLLVSQVMMVMAVFDSESSRLSFAKYAYDFTYDRDNYADVKEALHSSKSKEDLDHYLSGKMK